MYKLGVIYHAYNMRKIHKRCDLSRGVGLLCPDNDRLLIFVFDWISFPLTTMIFETSLMFVLILLQCMCMI